MSKSLQTPLDGPAVLTGIRVLDLSRVVAGPFCAALLGDMGADVIKIEDLEQGDESRTWVPQRLGQSAAYLANNRNKRGMTLNLKTAAGCDILKKLVADADVIVENFRTGTMEKFGLGYDVLSAINPRLVYCSMSAFGRTGPRAGEAGYEAVMQASSGIMSATGEVDGAPVRCGVSFIDATTGILGAFGVVSALRWRDRTGFGQRVDGSLFGTALSLLNFQGQGYLLSGVVPRRMGSAHPSIAPYKNFECADGEWVFIAGANDRLVKKLLVTLGLADLMQDPRFSTNGKRVEHRVEIEEIIGQAIARHPRVQLLRMLAQAGFPASPVNSMGQALDDEHTAATGALWSMEHPRLGDVRTVGFPLTFSGMQTSLRRHAPELGEHTDELLKHLGMDDNDIAALRRNNTVA